MQIGLPGIQMHFLHCFDITIVIQTAISINNDIAIRFDISAVINDRRNILDIFVKSLDNYIALGLDGAILVGGTSTLIIPSNYIHNACISLNTYIGICRDNLSSINQHFTSI